MIRQLRAVSGAVIGIGAGIIWWVRFLWAVGVLIFTAFLVVDLCRIPVLPQEIDESDGAPLANLAQTRFLNEQIRTHTNRVVVLKRKTSVPLDPD